MHLADAFIQSDLQCIQDIYVFISMCVPWELNPQPFALLTQCSTTEPQEHLIYSILLKNMTKQCIFAVLLLFGMFYCPTDDLFCSISMICSQIGY